MKKWLIRIVVLVVVLVVLAVVAVGLFLDSGIKKGVETVGPMLTKVSVKLDGVSLSLLSGSGKMKGLVVGNPEGYKTPSAIQVGLAELALEPRSVFSDKVVIKNINVQGPEITYETDLKGNNLSKILANLEEASGGSGGQAKPETEKKASKKLQVDNFVISGGKIHVSVTALGGKSATVPLPEIRLTDLGKGPDGITAAELTKRVLQAIEKSAVQAASGAVTDLGKQAGELTKGLQKDAGGAVDKATKGIGDLFKKK
ncbi:MAG TPA: AsmA family protein [Verrucomicrobiae bacterium]